MSRELQPEHPDFDAKVGDTREHKGKTYKFCENQYMGFWKAGPKDGTVVCSKDYPFAGSGPYKSGGITCKTFEDAADRAVVNAEREYQRAKAIVEAYEREDK